MQYLRHCPDVVQHVCSALPNVPVHPMYLCTAHNVAVNVYSSVTSVATDAGSTSVAPHTSISCHSRRPRGGEADTNLSFQARRLLGRINRSVSFSLRHFSVDHVMDLHLHFSMHQCLRLLSILMPAQFKLFRLKSCSPSHCMFAFRLSKIVWLALGQTFLHNLTTKMF